MKFFVSTLKVWLWCQLVVLIGFLLGFGINAVDPSTHGGWTPWRVGGLVALILEALTIVGSFVATTEAE